MQGMIIQITGPRRSSSRLQGCYCTRGWVSRETLEPSRFGWGHERLSAHPYSLGGGLPSHRAMGNAGRCCLAALRRSYTRFGRGIYALAEGGGGGPYGGCDQPDPDRVVAP